ncbi:DUF5753 domain-containing protein [Saccharothrix sp. Mg75]|uniref:DUF5753 domain-containing protein n=1 Tax=Saccharothrix sp. Mg75 TaxID=3445357 RepID=UPI003EEC4824
MNSEEKPHPARLSTARSRELGEELRRARRRARASSGQTAEGLEWSLGKLSKLETGTRGTLPSDIATLLGRYGTDKATRDRIMAVAHESNTDSFLRVHDGSPDTLAALAAHEPVARTVTAYEPLIVPLLGQTEDYALALTGGPNAAQTRMVRQRRLRQPGSRETVLYVNEAALRQVAAPPRVMRDQLLHLAAMCDWPMTCVRIVPLTCAPHPALRSPATLLTFEGPLRPLVYVETDVATVFHEDPQILVAYERKMRHLDTVALDVEQSRRILARCADSYQHHVA